MTSFVQLLVALPLLVSIGHPRCRHCCHAFSDPVSFPSRAGVASAKSLNLKMAVAPPPGGISATVVAMEEEEEDGGGVAIDGGRGIKTTKRVGINSRGAKMNEVSAMIDQLST